MIAKDIVRMTNQINKITEFIGQLTAVSMRISSMSSLNEVANAMESAGQAITTVSSKLDSGKLQQMMKTMAKEDAKKEMMQDMLDSIGEGMDDPEQQEELYKQVLSDVGLEVDKVLPQSHDAEVAKPEEVKEQQKVAVGAEEDSLDAMLKSL